MSQYDERALVLDVASYRETSSLVRLLTEHEGRISLVARGLRSAKINSGTAALQPFNVVRVRFSLKDGATMGNLSTAEIEQAAQAPHTSIDAYALISYWFEILKQTSQERAAMAGAFDLTMRMLRDQHTAPGLTLIYLQALSALCRVLGFGIEWNNCVACDTHRGTPARDLAFFSIARGGMVCTQCDRSGVLHGLKLSPGEISVAELIENDRGTEPVLTLELNTRDLFGMLGIINRYLVNHLEHPLRTFTFVTDTVGRPNQEA
jgi:DNA repair protein RecO